MNPAIGVYAGGVNRNQGANRINVFLCPSYSERSCGSTIDNVNGTNAYTIHYAGNMGPKGTNPVNGSASRRPVRCRSCSPTTPQRAEEHVDAVCPLVAVHPARVRPRSPGSSASRCCPARCTGGPGRSSPMLGSPSPGHCGNEPVAS